MNKIRTILCFVIAIMIFTILSCAISKNEYLRKLNKTNEIIADKKNISEYLKYEGITHDSVWVLEKEQMDSISTFIVQSIETNNNYIEFIKQNIRYYKKEYAGFYLENTKYVIVNMVLTNESNVSNQFTIIMDGGCSIVRLIINLKDKTIIKIECNGEA
jgi:hypothetical protein